FSPSSSSSLTAWRSSAVARSTAWARRATSSSTCAGAMRRDSEASGLVRMRARATPKPGEAAMPASVLPFAKPVLLELLLVLIEVMPHRLERFVLVDPRGAHVDFEAGEGREQEQSENALPVHLDALALDPDARAIAARHPRELARRPEVEGVLVRELQHGFLHRVNVRASPTRARAKRGRVRRGSPRADAPRPTPARDPRRPPARPAPRRRA